MAVIDRTYHLDCLTSSGLVVNVFYIIYLQIPHRRPVIKYSILNPSDGVISQVHVIHCLAVFEMGFDYFWYLVII